MGRRTDSDDLDKRRYGARANGDLSVHAWVQTSERTATTLPRQMAGGCHLLPYSCAPGHVSSWVLWFDLLSHATGDVRVAAGLAGMLEADMSHYLRRDRQVEFTLRQLLAWVALVNTMDGG